MTQHKPLFILNGPNQNRLGRREPEIYGTATLDEYVTSVRQVAATAGHTLEDLQSNHEGQLVDAIHAARGRVDAIIINAGAFTHYAWSLHDALATFSGPVIEVHISNPNAREPWRHTSVSSPIRLPRNSSPMSSAETGPTWRLPSAWNHSLT